jgi:hypothetical protein
MHLPSLHVKVPWDALGNSQTFIGSHDSFMEGLQFATGPPHHNCHGPYRPPLTVHREQLTESEACLIPDQDSDDVTRQ